MSEYRFDDRVAIVTGAGGGLGRAHALLLAARGARVVVNDLGGSVHGEGADASAAQKVVDEIRAAGGTAIASTHSVSSAESGRAIVETAVKEFGRLDIVVNNAGILRDSSFHKMTAEAFEAVLSVHLLGTFYVTQPAYAMMREAGYGRIVSTTSAAGLYGGFGQSNYAAAKAGLIGLTKCIAIEGEKRNIKANAISPGANSRMTEGIMPEKGLLTFTPEIVAPVVAYLCHEDCAVSGETLTAFGGHVGRAFIAETTGIDKEGLTIEDVAASIDEVMDVDGFKVPATAYESLGLS
ncbi:SDR family oxidoreductase [Mycobacterium palustre]|uniref:Short-chain dehydrogenase n=1 Tax=Mycobacterium palustre TaxID=153971 RepID=A0A1X1ZM41_9MYCO|nr:SDR family oxidoreductase [Mycobacterium palustre]ORW24382.1 short-chain dehydrogenase [Mycobacterium palustre]